MTYHVISFYRYTSLASPQTLCETLRAYCKKRSILGRILVASEGINGAVCGEFESIHAFQQYLSLLFSDLTFREQTIDSQAYHKLVVRVRPEIVAFGAPVDMTLPAPHVAPEQLKAWLDAREDVILLDARNAYEAAVGHFRGAVALPIENFRDFSLTVATLAPYKEKRIVMYCTGGVRCEKSSAYLRAQGFSSVYQLDGGIINYVNTCGAAHWQGGCFVFDDRKVASVSAPVTSCVHCATSTDNYLNCHNLDCDRLFVCCFSCQTQMASTCSVACQTAPRQRPVVSEQPSLVPLGRVMHYYPRRSVALVALHKPLSCGMQVAFSGKTTPLFSQPVAELRTDAGDVVSTLASGLATLPVQSLVRVHDTLFLVGA